MNKGFFTYIRVSTLKQGEHGVSLPEQRDTIERYAHEIKLLITRRFEDRESAAIQGRRAFNRMLQQLHAGDAIGVIFHKVDRSSRNSADWAAIDGLADRGFEVHFAHERLILSRRGDRLTANVQAVMAADESRVIRDRVKMGYYGRLKQGLFPGPAPLGYLNNGGGRPKTVDPQMGPLVRTLFDLYATGRFSLRTLGIEAGRLGLRTRRGKSLRLTQLNDILRNPFYAGVIHIAKTGESFSGVHKPLVSPAMFSRVQGILQGKAPKCAMIHDFLLRRLLTCSYCNHRLIGELQKGRVYYRCQTQGCPTTTVREDVAEAYFVKLLGTMQISSKERQELLDTLNDVRREDLHQREAREQARQLRLANVRAREQRLTDAWIDGLVDRSEFEERKTALLMEHRELEQAAASVSSADDANAVAKFLELASTACLLYENALPHERREFVEIMTSNRLVDGRTPLFTLVSPFAEWAHELQEQSGGPFRDTARTTALLQTLKCGLVNNVRLSEWMASRRRLSTLAA